jgi:hypothetical protein
LHASLDYPTFEGDTTGNKGGFVKCTGGRVYVHGHVEGRGETNTSIPAYAFDAIGNGAKIIITSTDLILGNRKTKAYFHSDISTGPRSAGITLRDCHLYMGEYEYDQLVDGDGLVEWDNVSSFNQDIRTPIATSMSLLRNHRFDDRTLEEWRITTPDMPPVIDTATKSRGSNSVLFSRDSSTGGSIAAMEVDFPANPGDMFFASLDVKLNLGVAANENFLRFGIYYLDKTETIILDSFFREIQSTENIFKTFHTGAFKAPRGTGKAMVKITTDLWNGEASALNKAWVGSVLINKAR